MSWTIRKKGQVYLIEKDRKGMKVLNPKDAEWIYKCLIYGASRENEVLASFSTKENIENDTQKGVYDTLSEPLTDDNKKKLEEKAKEELNKLMKDLL